MMPLIEDYIKNCPDKYTIHKILKGGECVSVEVPTPTIYWLVLHLWFSDRASFYDYEKKPEFTHTIKRARSFIANEYEKQLRHGNSTWAIFALKNFWREDKNTTELTGDKDKPLQWFTINVVDGKWTTNESD